MKPVFIIGNWKAYAMNLSPKDWVAEGVKQKSAIEKAEQETGRQHSIIICSPYSKLSLVRQAITEANLTDFIKLGCQDVSAFSPGAHTGDETVEQLKKDFGIEYTIIGHSERRKTYGEGDEMLAKKAQHALENGVTPIFCVQDDTNKVPQEVNIVAYEPPYAISAVSGGVADDPVRAAEEAERIRKNISQEVTMIYGGSVNAENVASFTNNQNLTRNFDGVLVGAKSLLPEFFQIVIHA